jgi:hypothetical protein
MATKKTEKKPVAKKKAAAPAGSASGKAKPSGLKRSGKPSAAAKKPAGTPAAVAAPHAAKPPPRLPQGPTARNCPLVLDGEVNAEKFSPNACLSCDEFDCRFCETGAGSGALGSRLFAGDEEGGDDEDGWSSDADFGADEDDGPDDDGDDESFF